MEITEEGDIEIHMQEKTMEITESEAREIIGAIRVSEFEQGESEEENPLATRIRKEFPDIDREIKDKTLKDYLWGEVAEADQRVIQARKKMNKTPLYLKFPDNEENPEHQKVQKEFMRIKGEVFRELWEMARKTGAR